MAVKKSKNKCKTGNSCGRSCISPLKTCRVVLYDKVSTFLDKKAEGKGVEKTKTPTSPPSSNSVNPLNLPVPVGEEGYDKDRVDILYPFSKMTGLGRDDSHETIEALRDWAMDGYKDYRQVDSGKSLADPKKDEETKAKVKRLNDFLENDGYPAFDGSVYRGINAKLGLKPGDSMNMDAMSSFSSSETVAKRFITNKENNSLVKVVSNKKGKHIGHLSVWDDEEEVLVPKGASYKVLSVTQSEADKNGKVFDIYEVEEV